MKIKIILFVVFALSLTTSAAAQKKLKMDLKIDRTTPVEKTLAANEQSAWKFLVDKNFDSFGKFLAEDYIGVYDIGATTKPTELAEIKKTTFKSAVVSNIKVKVLDAANAIVTSEVKLEVVTPDGQNGSQNARTTSFWVKRGSEWLVVYHSTVAIKQ